MSFIEAILLGISLAMDAFAASICRGLQHKKKAVADAILVSLTFGAFQFVMPVIGWFLGSAFATFIEPVDHWIAFILLLAIGAKMIWDGAHCSQDDPEGLEKKLGNYLEVFLLGIATSIDALIVGITLALIGVDIWMPAIVIGIVTFILSMIGSSIGSKFGTKYERPASIAGGIILILLGVKVLVEHLFF